MLKAKQCTEHNSFWLRPDTMQFIRKCSEITRIPQGQILQLIIDYYRTDRTMKKYKLKPEDLKETNKEIYDTVEYFMRIMPF